MVKRGTVVKWLERLSYGCRKSPEGRVIVRRFHHPSDNWKTLSVNPAVNGYLFESGKDKAVMDGWMTCDFTSFLTVFQSYQDDVWMIMKGCVQWNSIYC